MGLGIASARVRDEDVVPFFQHAHHAPEEFLLLLPGVRTRVSMRSAGDECVALAQQGRWWWWVSDLPWNDKPHETAVLRMVLGDLLRR